MADPVKQAREIADKLLDCITESYSEVGFNGPLYHYNFSDKGLAIIEDLLKEKLCERNEDGECFICKKETSALSSDPKMSPAWLLYYGGNGKRRVYHYGCVLKAVHEAEVREANKVGISDK